MQKSADKVNAGQAINDFVQKNRKIVFTCIGVVIILFVVSLATISLIDYLQKNAIAKVDNFDSRYKSLKININEESFSGDVENLLSDIEAFAKKTIPGFAKGKAWSIIGQIHSDRKNWPQAEAAWLSAASVSSKNYLGPIAFFNAAAAAEEQGKKAEAIGLYSKSAAHSMTFPSAPHAQFSIGRLNEELNDKAAAIEAYREVLAKWPKIPVWANLAQSRIIALETIGN